MERSTQLYIGLMSGTSMDGLDAVLVDFASTQPRLLRHYSHALPTDLKTELQRLCTPGHNELHRLATSDRLFAEYSAEVVMSLLQRAQVAPADIAAIGSHGQTVRHMPDTLTPYSVQLGDPNTLAALTGIPVVADFRRKDIALGGQGAPLVPAFHDALFRHQLLAENDSAAVLNLGGIANITLLTQEAENITGFDTGPANTLMDLWYQLQHPDSGLEFDKNGDYAAQGTLNHDLLEAMLADPYIQEAPPKSTGREYFNYRWLLGHLEHAGQVSGPDVQATLAEFTARSVALGLRRASAADVTKVFVAGGGAFNDHLMQRLATHYPAAQWQSVAVLGVDPQHLEAMAFAWLARQFMTRQPGNLPAVTGASRATVLGGLYLP
ncbi:Anhydro-N-acetylmuramic acid kinase [Pseudidiomarina piscicola]|uniref:Anhydro-N-acetylmuramic acid kinase n=1 Tax=Pseudidiomarina piscicola TaxID=2614830 RepID=A0A6S6WNI7_9GAMM|nr:anhydro-N-acetylmuramic acid kinase [Pseudidiomarina piscicola]CAB0151651.1 Anhydro-N-acetylmuramic acid kinase [Pseudidiomarina piscicola]VZT41116.1 Anhydro-N-acetylmuramic acid kinase [Pseudomonas aeruginosa]